MSSAEGPGPGSPEERLLRAIFGAAYVLPPADDEDDLPKAEREAVAEYLKDEAEELIDQLPLLEAGVLRLRLGIGKPPATKAQIAEALSIGEDEVDVVLSRGLRRLRRLEHGNDHP